MTCRGVGLILLMLCCAGCAYLEEPRWALLGDTSEQAFFIDRQGVERLANGNYRYPVKICLYQDGQRHKPDESHPSNQVLFVEMNCRERIWTEKGRGVMNPDDKILFRHLDTSPTSHPIEPGTIHFAAYNYLCGEDAIVAQHNH